MSVNLTKGKNNIRATSDLFDQQEIIKSGTFSVKVLKV